MASPLTGRGSAGQAAQRPTGVGLCGCLHGGLGPAGGVRRLFPAELCRYGRHHHPMAAAGSCNENPCGKNSARQWLAGSAGLLGHSLRCSQRPPPWWLRSPYSRFYFHRIALLSIPATLIALPALPLILATSMANGDGRNGPSHIGTGDRLAGLAAVDVSTGDSASLA